MTTDEKSIVHISNIKFISLRADFSKSPNSTKYEEILHIIKWNNHSMFFFSAIVFKTSDEIKLLNENKATGIVRISAKILKLSHSAIIHPRIDVINANWKNSTAPENFNFFTHYIKRAINSPLKI